MQYMLMHFETADEVNKRNNPELAPAYWAAWMAYVGAMNESGIVVSGNGLQPPNTGVKVSIHDGKRQIMDGPYADTKEHLGGYFIIEVDSLEQALEWAARSPSSLNGTTEVRPVLPPPHARMTPKVHQLAETIARESFGRLVSWLAYQWRDLAAAEDAMADALLKALTHWPTQGIPDSPEAWLLTVAKRQLLQKVRHEKLAQASRFFTETDEEFTDDNMSHLVAEIPDKRLALMLTCAHPAIEQAIRMPLMLQAVLGLQASEIASAMLMSPSALAQRLVRSKQTIRAQQLRFEEAEISDLPHRIQFLLEAIYGAYGISSEDVDGAESRIHNLTHESIFLCNLVCELLPTSAEAKGLLALMLFNQARKPAQSVSDDIFIPLPQQNTQLWDKKNDSTSRPRFTRCF